MSRSISRCKTVITTGKLLVLFWLIKSKYFYLILGIGFAKTWPLYCSKYRSFYYIKCLLKKWFRFLYLSLLMIPAVKRFLRNVWASSRPKFWIRIRSSPLDLCWTAATRPRPVIGPDSNNKEKIWRQFADRNFLKKLSNHYFLFKNVIFRYFSDIRSLGV